MKKNIKKMVAGSIPPPEVSIDQVRYVWKRPVETVVIGAKKIIRTGKEFFDVFPLPLVVIDNEERPIVPHEIIPDGIGIDTEAYEDKDGNDPKLFRYEGCFKRRIHS